MGAPLSSILCRPFWKTQINILMVGQNSPGKTTILYKLKLGDTVRVIPTCGYNAEVVHHKNCSFTIYDIGGGFRHQNLWIKCHNSIPGLIFVIDSNDRQGIEMIKSDFWAMIHADHLKNTVVLIFANKQDLPDVMTTPVLADELELNNLRNHRWHIQGVSAVTGDGLREGLDWLSNELANK